MIAPRAEDRYVAIWDWPVRLVHWAIATLFAVQWWAAETGHFDWHVRFGIVFLGLIVFRLLWGVFGSSTARFVHFVRGPLAVGCYAARLLRREPSEVVIGHNALGGWSVIAMLALLLLQVALGLFAVDTDGLNSGPLAAKVSFEQGRWAAHMHGLVFDALLVLVALHVAAIAFYLVVRRDNLVGAMLTGRRMAPAAAAPMSRAAGWRLLACVAAAVAAMWLAWSPPA